jgi:hypothetical protein
VSTTSPDVGEGGLKFADARGCKEWLNALPLTNLAQAQPLALAQLRSLNASAMPGIERLKCLELMRDKVGFMLGEQRARHLGAAVPLTAADQHAWAAAASLLEALEAGYRRCAEEAAGGDAELAPHAALLAQRTVRYVAAQMLWHALVRRRLPPPLWSRLHARYAEAEAAGQATSPVKDSLDSDAGISSVAEAYAQAVLMHAGMLSQMSAAEIDFGEALLRGWGRKLAVSAAPPADATARPLLVDLSQAVGPRHSADAPAGAATRYIDTNGVSLSLRKRIHGLQKGEDAASLGLPAQAGGVDALGELQRLHRWWCEAAPAKSAPHASQVARASVVHGIADLHFFVSGGKAFEQPGKTRELTPQEKQDIEVFGRITERTQSRMVGTERRVTAEAWPVVDEAMGTVRLERPANAAKPVGVGRLLGVRLGDTGDFYAGYVSEVSQEDDGRILATITIFPGKPQPIAVRAAIKGRTPDTWQPALGLPALEKLRIEASLIVPATLGARGRAIEVWTSAAAPATVRALLLRGIDFDRVVLG